MEPLPFVLHVAPLRLQGTHGAKPRWTRQTTIFISTQCPHLLGRNFPLHLFNRKGLESKWDSHESHGPTLGYLGCSEDKPYLQQGSLIGHSVPLTSHPKLGDNLHPPFLHGLGPSLQRSNQSTKHIAADDFTSRVKSESNVLWRASGSQQRWTNVSTLLWIH